jgi:hypothetical protein
MFCLIILVKGGHGRDLNLFIHDCLKLKYSK